MNEEGATPQTTPEGEVECDHDTTNHFSSLDGDELVTICLMCKQEINRLPWKRIFEALKKINMISGAGVDTSIINNIVDSK